MGVLKERSLKTLLTDLKDWFALKAKTVFSVNETEPVNGNVTIKQVDLANNLSSDKTQQSDGEFVIRTSGGNASIEDGDAFVLRILGNRVHNDYVPEELNMTVIPIPRVAPDPITAVLDESVFEAYVQGAGTYTLTYESGWSESPALYGVTVTGTPLDGDSIEIVWDGENDAEMTVTAPRTAPDPITATIDRDTFVAYVSQSGTITLTYTTAWSADPELYGITVVGDPVGGDQIQVVYVKEDRGTIVQATPSALKSTGWNLYNHTLGYARVCKYSETYGFRIGGTYSAISFSETVSGTQETITPVDGMFTVPSDGFVHVLGGNATDTYIINAWSDWTEGYAGEFKAYEESVVDISAAMTAYFPYGLMRVANVRDEINLNTLTAISRVGRMAYTAENLASAIASGRAYEADTNYIYIVKATEDVNAIAVDGSYAVNDHGNEIFYGSDVPVYLETLYGNNLKNKLERDVLTISQQTLTSAQQTQVRTNIGAFSQAGGDALNSKIATINRLSTNYISVTSLDDLKSKLITVSNTAEQNNTVIEIGIAVGYSSVEMPGWQSYYGQLNVSIKGQQFNGTFTSENGNTLTVSLNNSTWKIYSLNTKTTGTGTKVSSAISEFEFCRWRKVGSICIINFKFTTSSAITSNSEKLFTGFPKTTSGFNIAYAHSATSITGGEIRLRLGEDGSVGSLNNGYTSGGIPAGQWEGFVVYITDD